MSGKGNAQNNSDFHPLFWKCFLAKLSYYRLPGEAPISVWYPQQALQKLSLLMMLTKMLQSGSLRGSVTVNKTGKIDEISGQYRSFALVEISQLVLSSEKSSCCFSWGCFTFIESESQNIGRDHKDHQTPTPLK